MTQARSCGGRPLRVNTRPQEEMTMTKVDDAVIEARVRRALRSQGEVLRKTRPGRTWAKVNFGDYFTVDPHTGNPQRWHCDLEQLAAETGAIRPGERMR